MGERALVATEAAHARRWMVGGRVLLSPGFHPAPASPQAVETFIEFRSPAPAAHVPAAERIKFHKYVKPGAVREPLRAWSLRRALAAIGAVHRWLKYPDPTRDQDVKDAFKINVTGRQLQAQKDPLSWALRDKALVAVAHSTLFRRAELVALTVEDYRRAPGQDFGRMRVHKTKTDDPKNEKFRHVAPEAVERLDAWLRAARITQGPLFRGITPDRKIKPTALGVGEVARTFKRVARRGGLPEVSRIAAHSTRIGAVHDLKRAGADLLDIMQEGGWRSFMPQRLPAGPRKRSRGDGADGARPASAAAEAQVSLACRPSGEWTGARVEEAR